MEHINRLIALFKQKFHGEPEVIVRAPGRVNLLGEHTDYTGGLVLPLTIDKTIHLLARRRDDSRFHLLAHDLDRTLELREITRQTDPENHWANYILGVAHLLRQGGFAIGGIDGLVTGAIPPGAGLSSSAALEVATAHVFRHLFHLQLDPLDLIRLCQRAENNFVGVSCGIMDQFAAALGKSGHLLLLDCDTLDFSYVPLDAQQVSVAVCHTGIKHELAGSEYNKRVRECQEALTVVQKSRPEIRKLGLVSGSLWQSVEKDMPPLIARRCKHVVSENHRVRQGVEALKRGDIASFGRLMFESHRSLKELYEVSCPELDFLVELARSTEGVLGCKMTGAGFGGAAVALVRPSALSLFQERVKKAYRDKTGQEPEIFICTSSDGASVLSQGKKG